MGYKMKIGGVENPPRPQKKEESATPQEVPEKQTKIERPFKIVRPGDTLVNGVLVNEAFDPFKDAKNLHDEIAGNGPKEEADESQEFPGPMQDLGGELDKEIRAKQARELFEE